MTNDDAIRPGSRRRPGPLFFLSFFLLAAALLGAARAEALNAREESCRRELASASREWVIRRVALRQACVARSLRGRLAAPVDCLYGAGDARMARRFARIDLRLDRRVVDACTGIDLRLLSFPGPCADLAEDPAAFVPADLVACVRGLGRDAMDRLFAVEYPPAPGLARREGARCITGVGRRGFFMVARELTARGRCLELQERGDLPEDVDCRAQLAPFGEGSGEARLDRELERAQVATLVGIANSCATADLAEVGYTETACPRADASALTTFDLKWCNFDANVDAIGRLLALAFPTDPACGNGVREGDEECDDGSQNSATRPDACRETCLFPVCGDGVTDALSNDEECDDGNQAVGDGCTPACTAEFCGDGILCNGARCTSGPGGGREQCDAGAGNSDTAPDTCRRDCALPACGDGVTDPGLSEQCDDGDLVSGDGCSGPDSPLGRCRLEFCGDGVRQPGLDEQCDDGDANADEPDACRRDCTLPACGDRIVDTGAGEQCDDGNDDARDECSNFCTICGDGNVTGGEECDDGTANSDGDPEACNLACELPTVCTLTIGVTSSETLGALQWQIDYAALDGGFIGEGTDVACSALFGGGITSFNDNDAERKLRESIIVPAGFTGPIAVARCSFATHGAAPAPGAFTVEVLDASSPNFEPRSPAVAVTAVVCGEAAGG
jgi:cysteine-rich repeat protein